MCRLAQTFDEPRKNLATVLALETIQQVEHCFFTDQEWNVDEFHNEAVLTGWLGLVEFFAFQDEDSMNFDN
jgi:hypothetical protein